MINEEVHIKIEKVFLDYSDSDEYELPEEQDPISQEGYIRLCQELESDEQLYFHHFNMSKKAFDQLHQLVENDICKQTTNFKACIESKQRLMICLRYLKTGDSYTLISKDYLVGKTIISSIIVEVSKAIFENLRPHYMPKLTQEIWKENQKGFYKKWKVPNCVGSIVGRHIQSSYRRIKDETPDSLVLLAIVNPDHLFTVVDTGSYGNLNETKILERSPLYKQYLSKKQFLAPPKPLPGTLEPVSTVLVGDSEFPLLGYLMRPFPFSLSKKDPRVKKYNVRIRRARRVGERALALLTNKWRMFHFPMKCTNFKGVHCVRAACILHNYVRMQPDSILETEQELKDVRLWDPLLPLKVSNNRSGNIPMKIRQQFVDYFNR